jgi:hypothetical protein
MSMKPRHLDNYQAILYEFIQNEEALVKNVYACSQHVPTIGLGYALAEKSTGGFKPRAGLDDARGPRTVAGNHSKRPQPGTTPNQYEVRMRMGEVKAHQESIKGDRSWTESSICSEAMTKSLIAIGTITLPIMTTGTITGGGRDTGKQVIS